MHYVVGPAWSADGAWFYPRQQDSYSATGLAVVSSTGSAGDQTADGERYDPAIPAGAHPTLQLPCIIRVRNLENGREIQVRLDDRGPARSGRLLSLTPAAARLLQINPDQPARVSMTLEPDLSRALLFGLRDAPAPELQSAAVGLVQEHILPPAGTPEDAPADDASTQPAAARTPDQPPEPLNTVTLYRADPGRLWVDAGSFTALSSAIDLAGRLSGIVRQEGDRRSALYRVMFGPFATVPDADAALDRAQSAGLTGAQIIVQ